MAKATRKTTTTKTKRAAQKPAPAEAKAPRPPSKQARLVEMLRRPEGTTIEEIVKALEWQAHTARGAISGALKKKLGLAIESQKIDGRGRVYRVIE